MKMRVFIGFIGFLLPIVIIGGRLVDLESFHPTRHIRLSYNRDRIPVENFDGIVIKAHSLGNSAEIRKAPIKTYVEKNYNYQNEPQHSILTGVVGQAPQSIFTGVIGKVSQPNNFLQNPIHTLFTNNHNLLGTPNHVLMNSLLPQPQPILRADQLPNNQVPHGYVFIPGPLRPNGIHPMAAPSLMGNPSLIGNPSLMGTPTLVSPSLQQQPQQQLPFLAGQVVTIPPTILGGNNQVTPIPGFPTFAPFTMPPAFDKLVPEAREAKEKAERKYSPIRNYHSKMSLDSLENRLPKYKQRSSSKHKIESFDEKSQVWMVPYYDRK